MFPILILFSAKMTALCRRPPKHNSSQLYVNAKTENQYINHHAKSELTHLHLQLKPKQALTMKKIVSLNL